MDGLSEYEVEESRKKYGSNDIERTKKHSFIDLLITSLGDPIIKILLIALAVKSILLIQYFDWFETIGILIAIFLASFISSISEYGCEKAFEKLQEENSKLKVKVKRKKIKEININEVVVNDLVILEAGSKVPADGIIVDGSITVDESAINGETKEKYKAKNDQIYRGTTIYKGYAIMCVKKVGKDTFYGKIAIELQSKADDSPLKIRLRKLAKIISNMGYIGAILVSLSYLFNNIVIINNYDISLIKDTLTNIPLITSLIFYSLTLSVTIIVVAVPEGLPMMITLVLSSNMKRMLKNNVLVRKLVGIETAGSINVLLTDKTGTLTEGNMSVDKIFLGNLDEYNNNFSTYKNILYDHILYNNESFYIDNNVTGGNMTDQALLKYIGYSSREKTFTVENSFDSVNKYSSVIVDNKRYIKGAPDVLINYLKYYYDINGKKQLIDISKIRNKIKEESLKGSRILMICENRYSQNRFQELILVAIICIKDKIRKNVKQAIQIVEEAGIQTIIVTGDSLETATSIAKEINLINNNEIIIDSKKLNAMDDYELCQKFRKIKIVARALPQDKLRLVNIAKQLDLVVGMTGDGVNDAAALKKADVGFSLGSGTEVAKEASDIVILDDNFKSIVKAILFGRTIFKSIRKFIIFQLTMNICAVGISLIGPFIGIDTPITVIQMLWINMVMDTLAALAFSYEYPNMEYMKEKPKKKNENILNKYMINEIVYTGLYTCLLCILFLKLPLVDQYFNPQAKITAFFSIFVLSGIFNSLNARTHRLYLFSNLLRNKMFIIVMSFVVMVQICLIYFGGNIFRTVPLSFYQLTIVIAIAISVIPIDILRKLILRIFNKKGGV